MEVPRKTPEAIVLSQEHHAFAVIAREHQIDLGSIDDHEIPISVLEPEDGCDVEATVSILRKGERFSCMARTDLAMPDEILEQTADPFETLCEIYTGRDPWCPAVFLDADTLLIPQDQYTHIVVERKNATDMESYEQLEIYPQRKSDNGLATHGPDYFLELEEGGDMASIIQNTGRILAEFANIMQGLRSNIARGTLTISVPAQAVENKIESGKEYSPDHPTFDQIIGLAEEIEQLREYIYYFENPWDLEEGDERANGILLQGPEGTGKTMLVQAFANELGAVLRKISPGEISDKYVGVPTEKLRELFKESKAVDRPYVLYFNEMNGMFSKYAGGNSGVTEMLVSEFKSAMDDVQKDYPNVIVVGDANSLSNIDPALLRPGRFDVVLKLGLPNRFVRAALFGSLLVKKEAHFELMQFENSSAKEHDVDQRAPENPAVIKPLELADYTDGINPVGIKAIVKLAVDRRKQLMRQNKQSVPKITHADMIAAVNAYNKSRPSDI
jgi:AAA+ superfamily predicted ATPase